MLVGKNIYFSNKVNVTTNQSGYLPPGASIEE
jgi:hypothetical protein